MVLSIDPYNLNVFAFWGSILLLKVLSMAPLTSYQRFRKQCPAMICHHIDIPLFLISTLHFTYVLVESFALLFTVVAKIFRKVLKVFSNPEDTVFRKNSKVTFDDPEVERVRRAHLNDLESILPWFLATLLWLTTGPSTLLAGWLIRIFVVLRILHTIVYAVIPLPQPSRAIVFLLANFITGYMAAATIVHYFYY